MPDMTTVSDKFPVIDITHKPKRLQGENLKFLTNEERVDPMDDTDDAPKIVTLERAIQFYESHANGSYKNLYTQTAKWLREFMSRSIPIPDGTDVDKAQALLDKVRGGK